MSKGINKKLEKQSGMSKMFDMPLPHTKSLSRKNGIRFHVCVPILLRGLLHLEFLRL